MADIALDVEEFGFSAHLYYLINSLMDPAVFDNRNLTAYWLYRLDKLGVTTLKAQFAGISTASSGASPMSGNQRLMESGAAPPPANRAGNLEAELRTAAGVKPARRKPPSRCRYVAVELNRSPSSTLSTGTTRTLNG